MKNKYDTTETYTARAVVGDKEVTGHYVRASREYRRELDRKMLEAGKTKEIIFLPGGKKGFIWV